MELSHTFAINCIAREPFHLFICFHDGFSVGDRQPLWPRYPYPDRLLQFTGPLFLLAKPIVFMPYSFSIGRPNSETSVDRALALILSWPHRCAEQLGLPPPRARYLS